MNASVKVMRSYDYCHFEVALSAEDLDIDGVNELRKQAAVLVDEAVRQYKIAKRKERQRESNAYQLENVLERLERIKKIPESEWTPEQAAMMRSAADSTFFKEFREDDYWYADEEREHHFSMLSRFKESRVSAG